MYSPTCNDISGDNASGIRATPLKALTAPLNAFRTRCLFWPKGSVRLHHRFVGRTWLPDAWAARELLPRMHERRMLASPARATASYRDHQFAATAGFFRSPMFDASLSNGVRYLIAARCNAVWTTSRVIAAHRLRNGHPLVGRQCSICLTPLGAFSPVGHLITVCSDPRVQACRDAVGFSREYFDLLWTGFTRVRTLTALTTNRATHRYQAAGFVLTSGFFTQPLFDQPRSRGTRLLAALRMDGLWTARTAVRIPGLLVNHPFNLRDCILCNQNIADVRTFAHLVVDCVSLAHIRRDAELEPFIVMARQRLGAPAALEDIYTWLLGGATPAGLRLNDWLVGRAGQLGDRGNRPLAARLADFLGAAYTLYQAQLWQYHRARHAAAQG
ncbi:hypothetical protein HK105_200895 [Polyrhizophydium stewartii]|uniref:Reverse transcriptase zinc-binding domain-containing protein n=1 Tax=Polyrhizophydium stewartii TaxID=2732419 RepID=A0ABR4NI95_9FUNG